MNGEPGQQESFHGGAPPGPQPALTRLLDAVGRRANGELLCAGTRGEVHIYLQGGRIAWASDSGHRLAFTRHLVQNVGLDEASIEAVVAECRTTRRPIGEALVAWKLATREQVRDALRHQILQALDVAESMGECQTVFLPRQHYGEYDLELTFHFSELRPGLGEAEEPGHGAVAAMLEDLRGLDGYGGVAVLTPSGGWLAALDGCAARPRGVHQLASAPLLGEQGFTQALGLGRACQVHIEDDLAQILVGCLDAGGSPTHVHLVLVLAKEAPIGLARMRLIAVGERLAETLAGAPHQAATPPES